MQEDIKEKVLPEKFAAFVGEKFVGVYKKVNEEDIIAKAEFVYN